MADPVIPQSVDAPTPPSDQSAVSANLQRSTYTNNQAGEEQYKRSIEAHNKMNPDKAIQYTPTANYETVPATVKQAGTNVYTVGPAETAAQFASQAEADQYAKTYGKTPTPATETPSAPVVPATGTATSTTTSTATPTTNTDGITTDGGTDLLKNRTDQYIKDLQGVSDIYATGKAEDMASIQREYDARLASLDSAKKMLEELNAKRIESINSGAAAQSQEVEAAYKKQQAVVDLQKAQSDQAYKDMVNAQKLANKRANIRKETALGVLGGNFSTAGVAQIEDVIMQGEYAVTSIQKNADLAQRDLSDKAVNVIEDYKTANMKIEAWKVENTNAAFSDLQKQILTIQQSKDMAESEKEQAIRAAGSAYNDKVANLAGQAIQAKYNLAGEIITRSDTLKEQMLSQQNAERDDARTTLKDIVTNYSPTDLSHISDAQKAQMAELEKKAGYPVGFVTQGLETYKEQAAATKDKLAVLKQQGMNVSNLVTDNNGNMTGVIFNKATGAYTTVALGDFGKMAANKRFIQDPFTGELKVGDASTGTIDYSSVGNGGVGPGAGASGNPQDALNIPDGAVGGQCGHFVNQYTGLGVGDLYSDKYNKIASSLTSTPQMGDVFLSPYKDTGHMGFIIQDRGDGTVLVKDSNYGLDGKVQTHVMSKAGMVFAHVNSQGGSQGTPSSQGGPNDIFGAITNGINTFFNGSGNAKVKDPETMSKQELVAEAATYNKTTKEANQIASGDLKALRDYIQRQRAKAAADSQILENRAKKGSTTDTLLKALSS